MRYAIFVLFCMIVVRTVAQTDSLVIYTDSSAIAKSESSALAQISRRDFNLNRTHHAFSVAVPVFYFAVLSA